MTLIALLSTIAIPLIAFTNMANANFCAGPTNPKITFSSPVNTTYATNSVSLNVTIYTYLTGWGGGPREESYRHLEYSVDGNNFQPLNYTIAAMGQNPGGPAQFDCLIILYQLSEGNHKLTVKAVFDYYEYTPPEDLFHTESIANAYLTIDAIPDNTPTPNPTTTDNTSIVSGAFAPTTCYPIPCSDNGCSCFYFSILSANKTLNNEILTYPYRFVQ